MQIDENVLFDVTEEDCLSARHLLNANCITANDISFSNSESACSAVFDPGEKSWKSGDSNWLSGAASRGHIPLSDRACPRINGLYLQLRIHPVSPLQPSYLDRDMLQVPGVQHKKQS